MGTVVLFCALSAIPLAGCDDKFHEPVTLGGVTVAAKTLNQGHGVYRQHCASCHGIKGDGRGPSAESMTPLPRSFRLGYFKFSSAPKDQLPTDDDLRRTLRNGLAGTHMSSWKSLSDDDANAVVQYIKTFSTRWAKEPSGIAVQLGEDPWKGREEEAGRRGLALYHGKAECWTCHPSYVSREDIGRFRSLTMPESEGRKVPWREALERSQPAQTVHGNITPPDFLKDQLRSGSSETDIARTVAAGVGGTPMPAFHATIPPGDVWAIAHYVHALGALRGTPRAEEVRAAARGSTPTHPSAALTPAQPVAP